MAIDRIEAEVARNYDYFQRRLGDFLRDQDGRLPSCGQPASGFFDSPGEADRAGWTRFTDRLYSIQQVTANPVELGVYANGADRMAP